MEKERERERERCVTKVRSEQTGCQTGLVHPSVEEEEEEEEEKVFLQQSGGK